ncbi:MAG: glycosyltransferase family 2 protein [Bacteroidetes bacterium]|nr:glycosyltransferase family 2 protein [Bacteroidota bacterium]MCW5895857.1 glycosyltransferase family 2 protein [Bacteroidota bacterium]
MTTAPYARVLIILVNWNGKAVTLECLDSLAQLTYPDVEIVVVDNASTDGSADEFRKHHPHVVLLEQKENLRFAGGNNVGIKYALEQQADLVCLLNNDTTVDKDFLNHLVFRIQSEAKIGMVAPKIYYHDDPARIWFAGGEISMWTGTMKHTGIREIDSGQYDTTREIDYASGCCILTKREVVEKIGMLDELYFMYGEDADWCTRARRAGYSVYFEPKARVWHKLSVASGGHLSFFKMKNKFISNFRFFLRYSTLPQKLVFPWMNLLVNGWAGVRYLLTARQ